MQIIEIELLHEQAFNLLRQLEQLHILRLVTTTKEQQKSKVKPRQWAGSISKESAEKMLQFHQCM